MRCARLFLLTGLLTGPLAFAQDVSDRERGFTLTLPSGFKAHSKLVGASPDVIHAFVYGNPDDEVLDIILFIERMRGSIGRERLNPKQMPPGFKGRLFTTKWQGFELDAFEVPERIGEVSTITYNVQIPLKKEAIQVKLFGPMDRKSDLDAFLPQILDGLRGESNWLASAADPRVASSESYRIVLLVGMGLFVLVGIVVLWIISRRAPKGTVLALAAGIWMASWATDGIRIREVVGLTGAMRMLGFAGVILGLIDVFRKRKPSTPPDAPKPNSP